jgi:hypothetical protein
LTHSIRSWGKTLLWVLIKERNTHLARLCYICPRRKFTIQNPKDQTYRLGYGCVTPSNATQSTSFEIDSPPAKKKERKKKRLVYLVQRISGKTAPVRRLWRIHIELTKAGFDPFKYAHAHAIRGKDANDGHRKT